MASDVGASLPSAWQSQHYTNKSSAYHPTADCGTVSIRCLIFSQRLRSRIKGMMAFAPGTLQQGTAVWDLTGFPQSPPGPQLLRCLWRRLNSPCPAVRGRPFPGRGAALSPPGAVLGPAPVQDPSRGVGPRGLPTPPHPCRVAHELLIPSTVARRWPRGPQWGARLWP